MTLVYKPQLGLRIQVIDIGTQKINNLSLKTFKMVIASFQVINKLSKARFFQKIFLLGNITMRMVLGMFSLTFNNANP